MELDRNDTLNCEFGSSSEAGRPLLRIVGHVRVASRRWIAAEIGAYHQGENELADGLLESLRSGMVNLAGRGFPSVERFLAAAATGADLVWRWKNGGKCLPAGTLEVMPGGPGLVVMRESGGMLARRRQASRDHAAPRLPDTIARLVTFTILTGTRSGRRKVTLVRVLTTLLDHEEFPAREIARLYGQRWQIEIAFLHLKATVRGARRELRGQSPALARQEAWGLLLIHNLTATAVARAAVQAGTSPGLIPFASALALMRDRVTADTCCPHCGRRPVPAESQVKTLIDGIAGLPRHRAGRQRTSPRTAAERHNGHTENVSYTITIEKIKSPRMGHKFKYLRAVGPTRRDSTRSPDQLTVHRGHDNPGCDAMHAVPIAWMANVTNGWGDRRSGTSYLGPSPASRDGYGAIRAARQASFAAFDLLCSIQIAMSKIRNRLRSSPSGGRSESTLRRKDSSWKQ
jgi:hypothetical protein